MAPLPEPEPPSGNSRITQTTPDFPASKTYPELCPEIYYVKSTPFHESLLHSLSPAKAMLNRNPLAIPTYQSRAYLVTILKALGPTKLVVWIFGGQSTVPPLRSSLNEQMTNEVVMG